MTNAREHIFGPGTQNLKRCIFFWFYFRFLKYFFFLKSQIHPTKIDFKDIFLSYLLKLLGSIKIRLKQLRFRKLESMQPDFVKL